MTSDRFMAIRTDYAGRPFDRSDLDPDPHVQFLAWLEEAIEAGVPEPTAFVLATVDTSGAPSSRTVLLKELVPGGLAFYTNYESRKATDIESEPRVSALFLWLPLHRQVRIEGIVEKADAVTSDSYFATRPRDARLASVASPQSEVVPDRVYLERLLAAVESQCPGDVPRPDHWGGYWLRPNYYEFWQGREARFHDRFRYVESASGWLIDRLAP